jgi:hypothetical protein
MGRGGIRGLQARVAVKGKRCGRFTVPAGAGKAGKGKRVSPRRVK